MGIILGFENPVNLTKKLVRVTNNIQDMTILLSLT